jgi:hypothetical protein
VTQATTTVRLPEQVILPTLHSEQDSLEQRDVTEMMREGRDLI